VLFICKIKVSNKIPLRLFIILCVKNLFKKKQFIFLRLYIILSGLASQFLSIVVISIEYDVDFKEGKIFPPKRRVLPKLFASQSRPGLAAKCVYSVYQ